MQRDLICRRRATVVLIALVASVTIAACGGSSSVGPDGTSTAGAGLRADARCAAGARTLSARGDVLYPEVGNGGYTSVHTATHTVYEAATNRFLPGNQVDLTDRATRCLSSLSLDFESFEPGHPKGSPDMEVQSVSIDGAPASFRFAQPTYPGDPKGPDDPDPRAHEASQHNPVGGPDKNQLAPACSPELTGSPIPRCSGTNCTGGSIPLHGLAGWAPVPSRQAGDHPAGADR